jgi:hypothetical protein
MPALPSLPAALFHHAGSAAEEPWLFRAEGWDWRWHSWGEIASRVRAQAEQLSDRPAGSRVSFPYAPRPDEIVFDLAAQAAGLISAPTWGPPPEPSPPRGGSGSEGLGGAVVQRGGVAIELTAADLIAMADRLQQQVGPAKEREIVVLGGSLALPEERAMLSWATVAGAAIILEPNPSLRAATAAWARPTVFHGTPDEVAALRLWVEREKPGLLRRGKRLPFRRLRTVLVLGSPLTPEDESFWSERRVRVCRIAA